MNKTIKEASRDEIKEAYRSNAVVLIANKRREHIITSINDEGEVERGSTYGRFQAREENLLFEFRVWDSNKQRKKRLKERVSRIVASGRAIFLTLTFNDAYFGRDCSAETRRRYIRRFLKEQCKDYVANIDFGEKNGREHYHAIVEPKLQGIHFDSYMSAFDGSCIHGERVIPNGKSEESISLYINKLTNHALKDNGHCQRLIFSRR